MTRPAAGQADPASALARLLEAETRLEAMLVETRSRAEALVAAAEAEASGAAEAVERELANAEADSARQRSEATMERLGTLVREREASLARLSRTRSERVDVLAAWAAEQVIAEVIRAGKGP